MQAAPPETLAEGRFRLLEVIGEGGMATVYRAFDQRLQRPRAIKVLSPALATRPALRRRFLSEAQTMANLEESRVVRIFDMGEDGERVYIVMELVDGGSLVDRVRDYGPLPPRMAAEATIQICESLQAAHDAGVIHRDIKPHNILLTKNGEIRVTDFGIAQVQSDGDDGHTKTGAVMGTWGFMAPEQKSNAKTVDARADIYSVGATLWSLLTGQTPPELFMAETEPSMLDGLPEELAEVVKRATRYRREDRYVSARAMAESIRALVPMLPEDPELTVPLAPPLLERRGKPLDTMQQFESTGGSAPATMVPTLGGLPTAPPPAREPVQAPASLSAADSLVGARPPEARPTPPAEAPAPSRTPLLLGVGVVAVVGLFGLAALIAAPLLWSAATPDEAPPVAATPVEPAPTAPAVVPPPAPAPEVVPAAPSPVSTGASAGSVKADRPAPTPAVAPVASPAPEAAPAAPVVAEAPAVEAAPPKADPAAKAAAAIAHTPPTAAKLGESVPFAASLPGGGWTVKLYYRPAAGGAFQDKTMVPAGDTYTTSVKVTDDLSGGIAYFISATKGGVTLKEGSGTSPKRLAVEP